MNNKIDCRVGQLTTYDPKNCSHPNNPYAWAEYAIVHFEPSFFWARAKTLGAFLIIPAVHGPLDFSFWIQDIVLYKEHIVQ